MNKYSNKDCIHVYLGLTNDKESRKIRVIKPMGAFQIRKAFVLYKASLL